jgi:hypothetical protein
MISTIPLDLYMVGLYLKVLFDILYLRPIGNEAEKTKLCGQGIPNRP